MGRLDILLERTSSWIMIGKSELRIVGGGYYEVGRGGMSARRDAGKRIKDEGKEVGVCE